MRENYGNKSVKKGFFKTFVILFLLSFFSTFSWASPEENKLLSISDLQTLQKEVVTTDSLTDEMKVTLGKIYSSAIEAMQQVDEYEYIKNDYHRELLLTDQTLVSLLAELSELSVSPQVDSLDSMTVDQAEDALARERARHSANLAELHDQQLTADDMSETRSLISQRLGELDLRIDLLNKEYRAQQGSTEADVLRTAEKLRLLSLKAAAESESEMLRTRLDLLTGKSRYTPKNIDLAQRRVDYSQELVDIYEAQAKKLHEEQAEISLKNVKDLSTRLVSDFPQLSEIVSETELMAENLWGDEGLITSSEKISQALSEARNNQNQLRRISELALRKFETYGNRGNLSRWWPDMPEDFPEHGEVSRIIEKLKKEIPEIDHQLIILAQKRSKTFELNRQTLENIMKDMDGNLSTSDKQRIRTYLSLRQDLQDQLIQRGGVFANQLVEYQEVSKNLLNQISEVESFLFSHVLWSRSVPRPIIPRFHDIAVSAAWVFSFEHLKKFSIRNKDIRPGILVLTGFFFLLISIRGILRRRLVTLSQRVLDSRKDRFSLTPRAMVITLFLAFPLPLGLAVLGMITGLFGESHYWIAMSEALRYMAGVTLLLEITRMVFYRQGLAESHFQWPQQVTRGLYKGLLKSEIISMPVLFLSLLLAFAGGRLDSLQVYRIYNNSLGRVAFILSLLIFGLGILSLIKPEKRDKLSSEYTRVSWPRRFSAYAFPKAFLGAYPLIFFATIVPAILAMIGYYLTGILLAYQMLRTLFLLLLVFLASGLVQRSRQLATQNPENMQSSARSADSDRQARGMYKFLMVAVITVGVVAIWSDALPMLQFLKRVQILPRIQMIESQEDYSMKLETFSDSGGDNESPAAEGEQLSPVVDAVEDSSSKSPLTLWMIIEAILATGAVVVLVRGVPDITDMVLRSRTSMDHGARFTIRTLLRYTLTIVGTIIVFNFLGVDWSQIQWLAAALTFGLGFGLQEIVANFVSGLILLIERPIRVDDVVTIGDLMGKVSRIQIRATTITLWDRSEMVVPNKEFVTKKLVNWTLSDSKRRIDIPLRVVYGTDLDEVKAILVASAVDHSLVLDDPRPHAIIIDFAKDAINFELRFVVDFGNGIQVRDEVQMAIDRIFKEKGISFAIPRLNIQMSGSEPEKK